MFDFLKKKKVSAEEMALNMYLVFIRDAVKKPSKDIDGNIILDENEQRLLILSHLCELLEELDLKKVKLQLLSVFVRDNRKIESEGDLVVEMLVVADTIKKIKDFFRQMPSDSAEFVSKDWVFNKKLNPVQKIMILPWYVEHTKVVTSSLESIFKKVTIVDG